MSRSTISVFEHERLVLGTKGFEATHLDALARFESRFGDAYFRVGRKSVTFRQYVGYVQVGRLGIQVLPKVDRDGAAGRAYGLLLDMLRAARRLDVRTPTPSALATEPASLLDLFLVEFFESVEVLLHQGLAKAYRVERSNERMFRGRLLLREQIAANLVHAERFFVDHQTFDFDNVHNRILVTALHILARVPLAPNVARRHRRVLAAFPTVPPSGIGPRTFERLTYSRRTERYRRAVGIAEMIIARYAPRLARGEADVLSLLFDMDRLWEAWIARRLAERLPERYALRTQTSRAFFVASDHQRPLRPDIVIVERSSGRAVAALDTKWKRPKQGRPTGNDLRQMFAYNALFATPRAFLVYPSLAPRPPTSSGRYEPDGSSCESRYIALDDAERTLDDLIAAF